MAANSEMPKAGVDYPRSWVQFLDWFHSEDACRAFLDQLRWPSGFVCLKCEQPGTPCRSTRGRIMCSRCKFQTTVTAGTIFDKTRTELRIWFAGIWYITSQKHGISALSLQRVLGLGSYETAWTMLHRLRRAMVRPRRELLHGEVEVDETYLSIMDRKNPISAIGRKSNTSKVLVAMRLRCCSPRALAESGSNRFVKVITKA